MPPMKIFLKPLQRELWIMSEEKLYSLMPEGFEVPDGVDLQDKVVRRKAGNLPLISWPDGVPCVEANVYMRTLLHKGLSRRDGGGTLLTYAKNISHLIRYCHTNGWNFADLDDNRFTLFIRSLQARDALGKQKRTSEQILKIGRVCIDFLRTLQEFMGVNSFIGKKGKGCAITVEERGVKVQLSKGKARVIWVWSHRSFPSGSPLKTRRPISTAVVKKLDEATAKIEARQKKSRIELILACFKQTGGRRGEVSRLKVKDIEEACTQKGSAPLLRIVTLKKGGEGDYEDKEKVRYIPVPRDFLQQAMKYIQRHRRRIIREKIKSTSPKTISKDHGFLLVSETTGKRLTTDTLTTEINRLCVAAGVSDQPAHPHLFRHAYITEKLKAIIKHHHVANKDDFRKALLNVESFKYQVQQWTNHSNKNSLDSYIDLAFEANDNMDKVLNAVHLEAAVDVAQVRLASLRADIKASNATLPELMDELDGLLEALEGDIEDCFGSR